MIFEQIIVIIDCGVFVIWMIIEKIVSFYVYFCNLGNWVDD